MVSVNVAQLLQSPPGAIRQFQFKERLPDPAQDLRLKQPLAGHARLMRTSNGILVRVEYQTTVTLECARCLDETTVPIQHWVEEEFLPTYDIRTGLAIATEDDDPEQPRITAAHEIHLNELLRQDVITNLPWRPLCAPDCPGLCPTCGARLEPGHAAHPEPEAAEAEPEIRQPFAQLAVLLQEPDATAPADDGPRPASPARTDSV